MKKSLKNLKENSLLSSQFILVNNRQQRTLVLELSLVCEPQMSTMVKDFSKHRVQR